MPAERGNILVKILLPDHGMHTNTALITALADVGSSAADDYSRP